MILKIFRKNICHEVILDDDFDLRKINRAIYIGSAGYAQVCPLIRHDSPRLLHHYILSKKDGFDVDHINKNKLDNRPRNLRYLPHALNSLNSLLRSNNKTGITGICWNKKEKKWNAYINIMKKRTHLGWHKCPVMAVLIRKHYESLAFKFNNGELNGPTNT